jgi:hypothetical protein
MNREWLKFEWLNMQRADDNVAEQGNEKKR